jgi:hypothetical protein
MKIEGLSDPAKTNPIYPYRRGNKPHFKRADFAVLRSVAHDKYRLFLCVYPPRRLAVSLWLFCGLCRIWYRLDNLMPQNEEALAPKAGYMFKRKM